MTARQPSVPNLICPMTSTPDSRLFVHDLLHLAQRRLEVPMLEKPGAADKGVRAGMGALSGGLKIDTAVHLDTVVEILLFSPRVSLLKFGECCGNEWLPAETRIDRHDQQHVNLNEVRLHLGHARAGPDGRANPLAQRSNVPEQPRH